MKPWVLGCLFAGVAFGAQVALAGGIDELSPADQAKVKRGEQVSVFEKSEVPGAPWPNSKVYQWIPGVTPEEAMAMFSDYELQSAYVPDLKKSVISSYVKNVAHIDYTVALPMGFGSEDYTAVDTLTAYADGSGYVVAWDVIPTKSIKMANGSARFETLATDAGPGTLFSYVNFIYPDRWGTSMGWVVEAAKRRVRDTVTATVQFIAKEKSTNPDRLKAQMGRMRSILETITQN